MTNLAQGLALVLVAALVTASPMPIFRYSTSIGRAYVLSCFAVLGGLGIAFVGACFLLAS